MQQRHCEAKYQLRKNSCKLTIAYMSDDKSISLGKRLRELRERAGLSLRELAKSAQISAPFLSDIELGRRYPKDETLAILAKHLSTSMDGLKNLDYRKAIGELKRFSEETPSLGAVLQKLVHQVNTGALPATELATKLNQIINPPEN